MSFFQNRVAVITGAASGIGRALALELAQRGACLAISDIDSAGLRVTEGAVLELGAECLVFDMDVADHESFREFRDLILSRFERVDLLFNNAGVALRSSVEETTREDFDWLMRINFWGVVSGTQLFLEPMRAQNSGHIINISSVFGIIGVPTQAAYNASKFAVRGFTEALRQELVLEKSGVKASCVHPGGIRTNIARNGRMRALSRFDESQDPVKSFDQMARTTPEDAAKVILRGVERGDARILVGADAHAIDLVQRLLPVRYQSLVMRFFAQSFRPKA